jgi:uncharacterized protein (DUF697 family)
MLAAKSTPGLLRCLLGELLALAQRRLDDLEPADVGEEVARRLVRALVVRVRDMGTLDARHAFLGGAIGAVGSVSIGVAVGAICRRFFDGRAHNCNWAYVSV